MATLNLFPVRAAIGLVQKDGTVLMTQEFARALADLLERVGGQSSIGVSDLEIMASLVETPDSTVPRAITDVLAAQPISNNASVVSLAQQVEEMQTQYQANSAAAMAALAQRVEDMQIQIVAMADANAKVAALAQAIEDATIGTFMDPYRVNWERPGTIGALTASSGAFTTISGNTLTVKGGATFLTTSTALTNGAAAAIGTIANAPVAGNPTKWIGINDNGTVRYIPAW